MAIYCRSFVLPWSRWRTPMAMNFSSNILPYHSIPAPKGLPVIGTLWDVIRAGGVSQIHRYIDDRHRQLGPIFREKLGHVEAVWLASPKLYQQVYQNEGAFPRLMLPEPWMIFNRKHAYKRGLFFMQGEEWALYRKILSPLLLKLATLRRNLESLDEVADLTLSKWQNADNNSSIADLESDLYRYFTQGLICAMFGRNVGLDPKILETSGSQMVEHLQGLFEYSARLTLLPPSLAAQLKLKVWQNFEKSAFNALHVAKHLADSCMESMKKSDDKDLDSGCIVASLQQQKVPHDVIERIVTDLFLAAADTTSHTTQWVLYLLANHPEVQTKAAQEIAEISSRTNRACDHATTHSIWQTPTIRGAVKEALRLYPVATFLTRILPKETVIGNYTIPAETLVLMSIYTSGRSEEYFSNAELFVPERWERSQLSSGKTMCSEPFASLPFGHGKRACIGRRLAEVQMYILLTKIISKFTLESENHVEMVMRLLGTVSEPVRLRIKPRC